MHLPNLIHSILLLILFNYYGSTHSTVNLNIFSLVSEQKTNFQLRKFCTYKFISILTPKYAYLIRIIQKHFIFTGTFKKVLKHFS